MALTPGIPKIERDQRRRYGPSGALPLESVCDRVREPELRDAAPAGWRIEPRVSRWSESTADITAFRRGMLDGPFAVDPASADLLAFSLGRAVGEERPESAEPRRRRRCADTGFSERPSSRPVPSLTAVAAHKAASHGVRRAGSRIR